MSDADPQPPGWTRALPREFWPLQLATVFPEVPQIPPTLPSDYPPDEFNQLAAANIIQTASYLRAGFCKGDEPEDALGRLPRTAWIRTLADLLRDATLGLQAAHLNTKAITPPLANLAPDDERTLRHIREANRKLYAFFNNRDIDLDYYTPDDICLRCVSEADPETTKDLLKATLKSCGNDVAAARVSIFNLRRREIEQEVDTWAMSVLEDCKSAIINQITHKDVPVVPYGDERLGDWIAAQAARLQRATLDHLADETLGKALEPWYAETIGAAKSHLQDQFSKDYEDFHASLVSRLDESKADESKAAERELNEFRNELKIANQTAKDNARLALVSNARARYTPSQPTLQLDRRPSRHATPHRTPAPLPTHEVVPSSQTPPPMTALLSPVQISQPVPFDHPPMEEDSRNKTPTPKPPKPNPPNPNDPVMAAIAALTEHISAQVAKLDAKLDDKVDKIWQRLDEYDEDQPLSELADGEDWADPELDNRNWRATPADPVTGDDAPISSSDDPLLRNLYATFFHISEPVGLISPDSQQAINSFGGVWKGWCIESHIPVTYNLRDINKGTLARFENEAALFLCDAKPPPELSNVPFLTAGPTAPPDWEMVDIGPVGPARNPSATSAPRPYPGPPERAKPVTYSRTQVPSKYEWATVVKKGKPTFADKARAANTPAPTPQPPRTDLADSDTRQHLMQATEAEIRALWQQRFSQPVPKTFKTKAAVVEAYILGNPKSRTPSQPARPTPTQLRNAEWTVTKGQAFENMPRDRRPTPTKLVTDIQHRLHLAANSSGGDTPRLTLLGGRWSSNEAAANFVLTFAGHPDPSEIMRHADILSAPFGRGSYIVPKAGFSRIRLFDVPVLDNAKDSDSLRAQIVRNPGLTDLRFIESPRWMFPEQIHEKEQIIFTIFDPTGADTKKLLKSAPFLFGTRCRARKFDSRPILHQCERCHVLGHSTLRCTRPASFVRCERCGRGHETAQHVDRCPSRNTHETLRACDCPVECFNCKDARKHFKGHLARSDQCPLRKMYRAQGPNQAPRGPQVRRHPSETPTARIDDVDNDTPAPEARTTDATPAPIAQPPNAVEGAQIIEIH